MLTNLITTPLQSLRFDILSIALSYEDSYYCKRLFPLLIFFDTKTPYQLCFVIARIRDVGGLEQAYDVSNHLQTLSLKTWDMSVD